MTTLVLSATGSNASNFTIDFDSPIDVKKTDQYHWEVSLRSVTYTYSMRNIDSSYNNHTFMYSSDGGSTWNTVTLSGGIYSVEDIDTAFKAVMKANGDYTAGATPDLDVYYITFTVNYSTQRVKQVISDSNYRLDFSTGDFYKLIGANAAVVSATVEGPNQADINRGVTSYNIHTDFTTGTYVNGRVDNVIYNFIPNASAGYVIRDEPKVLDFVPIKSIDYLRSINIYFTDQNNRAISFFGEPVTVVLRLEKRAN